ncbi:MAG TPA: hypothetical protein VM325_11315 [Alphaproteobacteria bacterium]|nr:hypothetical protein [Alphaproteobacteria bacterium]
MDDNVRFTVPYQPIVLMISSDKLMEIKRIFPFDSGAFKAGLLAEFVHRDMTIDKFEVEPKIEMCARAVSAFFETNEQYYEGSPSAAGKTRGLSFEIESFAEMITGFFKSGADDRKCSFEIQHKLRIKLSDRLMAVALPRRELARSYVKEFLQKHQNIDVLTYPSTSTSSMVTCYERILQTFWIYLSNKGYFLKE